MRIWGKARHHGNHVPSEGKICSQTKSTWKVNRVDQMHWEAVEHQSKQEMLSQTKMSSPPLSPAQVEADGQPGFLGHGRSFTRDLCVSAVGSPQDRQGQRRDGNSQHFTSQPLYGKCTRSPHIRLSSVTTMHPHAANTRDRDSKGPLCPNNGKGFVSCMCVLLFHH